jgi:hypothetical protein
LALTNIATLEFTECESGDTGLFIVDAGPERVRVCLSLLQNGDTEAVLAVEDARRALAALQAAIARAEQGSR